MNDIFTRREKLLNAAYRLNADAYVMQVKAHKGRKMRQFTPCDKAGIFTKAIDDRRVIMEIVNAAYFVDCPCHRGLKETGLIDMLYDDTYRLAHYRGDHRALYPGLQP